MTAGHAKGSKRLARTESGGGLGFLVEDPPARLLIAAGCSAGQSGEKEAGGFCQFWFWWVDALLVVFRRTKKIRSLLCPRLLLDLCACLGVGAFGLCFWDKWECSAAGA